MSASILLTVSYAGNSKVKFPLYCCCRWAHTTMSKHRNDKTVLYDQTHWHHGHNVCW